MARFQRDWFVPFVAVVVIVADQWSKAFVRSHLPLGVPWDPVPALRPILSFTHVQNLGAVFGLFPQLHWFYPIPSVIVTCLLLVLYRRFASYGPIVLLAFGLQLGGTVGNLIDRLRQGYVTDFIDLNFWPLQEWAVFNIADSAVVVGVVILAAYMLLAGELDPDRDHLDVLPG